MLTNPDFCKFSAPVSNFLRGHGGNEPRRGHWQELCVSHSHRELEGSPGQPQNCPSSPQLCEKDKTESINCHKPAVKSIWPLQTIVTVHRADFMSCRQQVKLCLHCSCSPHPQRLSWAGNFNGTGVKCHSFHTLHKHKVPRIGPHGQREIHRLSLSWLTWINLKNLLNTRKIGSSCYCHILVLSQ